MFFALVQAEGEAVVPLALHAVDRVFVRAFALLPHRGRERVPFSGQPALAGVVDLGDVAAAGGDVGVFFEFDIRGACYERFDVQSGQGDEIGFRLVGGAGGRESKQGVADLFHIDGAGERRFLGVVALELEMVSTRGWVGRLHRGDGLPERHVWRWLCSMQSRAGGG